MAIEKESDPTRKLSKQTIITINGLTRYYRLKDNDRFKSVVEPLFRKCKMKLELP